MKLVHTRTKIFFPNPYVVRVEYSKEIPDTQAEANFRNTVRNTYRLIQGTWGHSSLHIEWDEKFTIPPNVLNLIQIGINQQRVIMAQTNETALRGYFCFEDESDALQFRLSINVTAIQVKMWPERWFTIHEVVKA